MVTQVVIGTQTVAGGGSAWLAPGPAASWQRMEQAGMPAGGITEAGRTHERQAEVYADYLAGRLLATAAKPGSPQARHESGYAIDVQTTSTTQVWLIAHGAEHGWTRPLLRAAKPEPWHWEYGLLTDQHLVPDAPDLTAPTLLEDDTMVIISTTTPWGSTAYALLHEVGGAEGLDDMWVQVYGPISRIVPVPWDHWNGLVAAAWDRHARLVAALGGQVTETVEGALQRVLTAAGAQQG